LSNIDEVEKEIENLKRKLEKLAYLTMENTAFLEFYQRIEREISIKEEERDALTRAAELISGNKARQNMNESRYSLGAHGTF